MEHERPQTTPGGDGQRAGGARTAVKIVAVLVVLPVRVIWDLLTALGRGLARVYRRAVLPVLRGLGRVLVVLLKLLFVWPWVGLWRYALVPAGRAAAWLGRTAYTYLLAPLGRLLYAYALHPLGRAVARLAAAIWTHVLIPAGRGLFRLAVAGCRYVLVPLAQGLVRLLSWVWRYLLKPLGLGLWWPARGLHRYVLTPLGQALAGAWRVAGRITRALWRGTVRAGRALFGRPLAWVNRRVATPAGHLAREAWHTVRTTVREARTEVRRVFSRTPPAQPARSQARTLGSTTAMGDTPAPEISPRKPQG
ncbi:hypothetical protein [Streptomyces sp. NPDC051567]|uniref:hypothetical protein n=1 Tax=Streptomyces sp. NPDC051567 TaxID=3365660 RepID=UPI0037B911D0